MTRPNSVRDLLVEHSAHLSPPGLADAAWAEAGRRRSRRRWVVTAATAAAVSTVVAGTIAGAAWLPDTSPKQPAASSSGTGTRGELSGIPYTLGPQAGSEAGLQVLDAPLGAQVELPHGTLPELTDSTLNSVLAATLRPVGQGIYRAVLLGPAKTFAEVPRDLTEVRDKAGNSLPPLDPTALWRGQSGLAAFAQPGAVLIVNGRTGVVTKVSLPDPYIEHVQWDESQLAATNILKLVAFSDTAAFSVDIRVSGHDVVDVATSASQRPPIAGGQEEFSGLSLTKVDGSPVLVDHGDSGSSANAGLRLPVEQWGTPGFASGGLVARQFFSRSVTEFGPISGVANPTAVGAVDSVSKQESMLVLPSGPGRSLGDGRVLGWLQGHWVLYETGPVTVGTESRWILAWDFRSGDVRRVAQLRIDDMPIAVALDSAS